MELNTESLSPNPIAAVNDDNDRLCQNLISLLERIEERSRLRNETCPQESLCLLIVHLKNFGH